MHTIIDPEKMHRLDTIFLDEGPHISFHDGHCAMEVAAWLAGEPHSDKPSCVSPVLRRFMISINDYWSFNRRQVLKPFIPRIINTRGDGKDGQRMLILARAAQSFYADWLEIPGFDSAPLRNAATPAEAASVYQDVWRAAGRKIFELEEVFRSQISDAWNDQEKLKPNSTYDAHWRDKLLDEAVDAAKCGAGSFAKIDEKFAAARATAVTLRRTQWASEVLHPQFLAGINQMRDLTQLMIAMSSVNTVAETLHLYSADRPGLRSCVAHNVELSCVRHGARSMWPVGSLAFTHDNKALDLLTELIKADT